MKKVIARKVYNTETAEELANASFGNVGDFSAWYEQLYRTPKGAFFIAGEGGPMTRYAESLGSQGLNGGKAIRPVSVEEALDWCERNSIDVATMRRIAPDAIEDA